MGYRVEHTELNAADFGAATSRNRLFVIARKGNRAPVFPSATHAKLAGGLFGLPRWRAAAEIIDWSIPCQSIFGRKRPLADKTLLRIEAGLRRFVGPFLVPNFGEAPGQEPRTHSIGDALPVITSHGAGAIVAPFILPRQGFYDSHKLKRCRGVDEPVPTITASHIPGALIIPWLSQFYGNETQSRADAPVPTITTKDRHSLCVARFTPAEWPEPTSDAMRTLQATMRELGVADIGFRMLSNPELAAAQGFPSSYIFTGTKSDVTKQIGNSVSPDVAKAITMALAG